MVVTLLVIVYIIISLICIGSLTLGLYQKNINLMCNSKRRLDGKTAIVTGGTSGIGLEIAIDFAQRGARVIVACPFQEEGDNGKKLIIKRSGNENVIFEHLDLSSFASVRKFSANIIANESRLDILVNNAGVNMPPRMTDDNLNFIMQVNYYGAVLLTLLLLPLLNKTGRPGEPSKIITTTSFFHKRGSIDVANWNKSDSSWVCYADSKLAIVLFTRELARRIQHRNIIANVVDPGIVGTPILLKPAMFLGPFVVFMASAIFKTPWEGAQSAIFAAVSEEALHQNGKCIYNCQVMMSKLSHHNNDDKLCKHVWETTMNSVGFEDSVVLVS
ncbi:dehydrogenase/reductase SDR family member 13-like [Plodia interpunctella]|uniref:dehydrogenase/reductase SDR family member 13-like n=1 Tax=Plodia interpunctella TaxID=58824 RepID=UPI002368A938|nr:dehydrogenase/reductase SDR family member 13-like [Plodia interpunctella]